MKKFLRKNVKFIVKWSIVLILSFVLYRILHDMATVKRGYNAIGGEIFMFLIPFFVCIAPDIKKTIKEIKDVLSR